MRQLKFVKMFKCAVTFYLWTFCDSCYHAHSQKITFWNQIKLESKLLRYQMLQEPFDHSLYVLLELPLVGHLLLMINTGIPLAGVELYCKKQKTKLLLLSKAGVCFTITSVFVIDVYIWNETRAIFAEQLLTGGKLWNRRCFTGWKLWKYGGVYRGYGVWPEWKTHASCGLLNCGTIMSTAIFPVLSPDFHTPNIVILDETYPGRVFNFSYQLPMKPVNNLGMFICLPPQFRSRQ